MFNFFSNLFIFTIFLDVFSNPFLTDTFHRYVHQLLQLFLQFTTCLAIGIFDQDVDVDHALKFRIFEWVIHVLVKNSDGKNMLGTLENVVTGDEHIYTKFL